MNENVTSGGRPAIVAYARAWGMTVIPTVIPAMKSEMESWKVYLVIHCRIGNREYSVFFRKMRSFCLFQLGIETPSSFTRPGLSWTTDP